MGMGAWDIKIPCKGVKVGQAALKRRPGTGWLAGVSIQSSILLLYSVIILLRVCQFFEFGQNGVMSITPHQRQLNDAIAIAAAVHSDQVRKPPDGRPYICHVLDVVNGLPNDLPLQDPNFKDVHLKRLVAALHDTIEDVADKEDVAEEADKKRAELRNKILVQFGPEVLAGVEAMTHLKPEGLSEEAELAHYIDYVETRVLANDAAVAVKVIDNYVNMKDCVTQFVDGGKDAENARRKLHQYASSIALLTKKKEKTAK